MSALVAIKYTAPGGSPVDITASVIYESAYFESQFAAVPGSFEITVRDPDQTLSFAAGGEVTLDVDGVRYFGGFVLQVTRQFIVPVDDTVTQLPSAVQSRQWLLAGTDYNILLDKRVIRNTGDYLHLITIAAPVADGDLIRTNFGTYFDLDGLDVTTKVANVNTYVTPENFQQGLTLRQVLDSLVIDTTVLATGTATVFWIDGSKRLNWVGLQTATAPFGFSDAPATAGAGYIGFRDGRATEDATSIANDVYVWGGSPFTPTGGGVVVGHASNATSITNHRRWQFAETHMGEAGFGLTGGVQARANALVSGETTGTSAREGSQGLVNPGLQFTLTWFSEDVPVVMGVPQHLTPGFVTTLALYSFGSPFTYSVPARQIRITFPIIEGDGTARALVQFEGTFGIQLSDPVWLWDYLRHFKPRTNAQAATLVATADNGSVSPATGSRYQGVPSPATDGSTMIFTIPFAYVAGSTNVFVNGLLQTLTSSYTESDPATGEITFTWAPLVTDSIFVEATLA